MTIRKTIAIALLGIGLTLAAQAADATNLGPVISQAYEVALGDFRAPGTRNGTVSFKECEDCESKTVRVTAETRYAINGRTVRLEDFRKRVAEAGGRNGAAVTVLHHLESDTIVQINVSL